jgi:hypothetical protein
MRIGLLVLTMFAAAWASVGLLVSGGARGLILLPIALSLALLACGWRGSGLVRSRGPHVGKLVGLWSAIEGVAIIVTENVLQNLHRGDLIFPSVAIIVGLHFFPLARGIPVRLYHATGAGFVFAGLVGLLLPAAERPMAVGMSAALILWATALVVVLRARQVAATSPSASAASVSSPKRIVKS